MRRRPGLLIVAPILAAGLLACQLIVGVKDDEGTVRPDGGVEAGAVATCALRTTPGPPTADTPGAVDDGLIHYLAFARILVDPDGGPRPGYDLDGRCTGLPTTPGSPSTIADSPCTTVGPPPRDGDGGVDNVLPGILSHFPLNARPSDDLLANFFNDDIEAGTRTLVLAVGRYNGADDDTEVTAALLSSEGLVGDAGAPRFDGEDSWSHTESWGNAPTLPLSGHVTGGVLVTEPAAFTLGFGTFVLSIKEGSIIASIDRAQPLWRMEGTIVGKTLANDFIASMGQVPINDRRCLLTDTPAASDAICPLRDVRVSDGTGATTACNAVSLAIGFRGVSAIVPKGAQKTIDLTGTACDASHCAP